MIDKAIFALPGIKKVLVFLVGLSLTRALLTIGQAWFLSVAIIGLWSGELIFDQMVSVALFFLCFIGRQAAIYLQDQRLDRYAYEQADILRQKLLERIFLEGPRIVQEEGTGNITTTVLDGIEQVEMYIRLMLPKLTGILIIPLMLLIPVLVLDGVSGFILFLVFPFIILYMIMLGYNARDKAAKQYKSHQLLSNHFIDSLRGLDTLKLFGISKQYGEKVYASSERFREATMKTLRIAFLSSFALDLFSTFSVAAVAIMLGYRLLDGSLEFFPALVSLVLAPEFFKPIREFAADYHASLDGKNALKTVLDVIDLPWTAAEQTSLPIWQANTNLRLEELDFAYPDYQALIDISLSTTGFKKIGIIGTSGSGKSTLINVLGGFFSPKNGTISVAGNTLTNLDQVDWQKQVIYIPQNPYIFHASLRENLTFYHPQASDSEIKSAIEVAGLKNMIDELPEGINTKIGEGARALSGGQAQRIALARAFLDRTRTILLFDEPTAHLDIETEMELKERMLPLMENRLVFFATHRLHWMNEMDSIIVMEEGSIAEQGTLSQLSSHDGAFAKLASQLRGGKA